MIPLLGLANESKTLLWHSGRAITRGGFCRAAAALAERLPQARYAVNLASGRMAFMLGFAAAALRSQTILLPPNQTQASLELLRHEYPELHILDDAVLEALDIAAQTSQVSLTSPLQLPPDQITAILFTSGSTGVPQPHAKSWSVLARTGALDAERFLPPVLVGASQEPLNLIATVPSQHMFGLQTTVLLPFAGNCAIFDGRPFFPADIRLALESVPAPRALISTPMHLNNCVMSDLSLPPLEFVLSATAPMPLDLAHTIESRWGTRVLEIYGSTEAGTIGTRRATRSEFWRLLPGAELIANDSGICYRAKHLPEPLLLADHVETISPLEFRLIGRASDQVKIAGKRASFVELTRALLSVPGVLDGAIFLPPDSSRTAALAVAPELNRNQLLDELAKRIDPVFLPRPLVLVDKLPRTAVGKLPRDALMAALTSAQDS